MSSHYVYAIINRSNLKLYFGSHSWEGTGVDPNYYGSGKIIKQAVNKYGKDNFIIQPIKFYDTIEECRKAEEELLTKYDISNNPYCYNIKNGAVGWTSEDMKGEKNPMYGRTLSAEHRNKISENHADMSGEKHPMYGKHHTSDTKKKMSQALKGKTQSAEHRNKIAISNGGKPFVAIKDGKVKIFTSKHGCSRVLGLDCSSIRKCLKGKLKTTGGYSFKYVEELDSGIYEGIL